MAKTCFDDILDKIRQDITKQHINWRRPIPQEERLAIAIRLLRLFITTTINLVGILLHNKASLLLVLLWRMFAKLYGKRWHLNLCHTRHGRYRKIAQNCLKKNGFSELHWCN